MDPDGVGYVCARCPDQTRVARRCPKPLSDPGPYRALQRALPPTRWAEESCDVLKVHPLAWRLLGLARHYEHGQTWNGAGLGGEPARLLDLAELAQAALAAADAERLERTRARAELDAKR